MAIQCGIEEENWTPLAGQDLLTGSANRNGLRYDVIKNAVWTHPHEGGVVASIVAAPAVQNRDAGTYYDPAVNPVWGNEAPACTLANTGTRVLNAMPFMSGQVHTEEILNAFLSVGLRMKINGVDYQDAVIQGGITVPLDAFGQVAGTVLNTSLSTIVKVGGMITYIGAEIAIAPGTSQFVTAVPIQIRHSGSWVGAAVFGSPNRYRWQDHLRVGWIAARPGPLGM